MITKLTHVFPPEIKPVNFGVYAVATLAEDGAIATGFARFDGVWGCIYPTLEEAEAQPMDAFYADQAKYWQGVL